MPSKFIGTKFDILTILIVSGINVYTGVLDIGIGQRIIQIGPEILYNFGVKSIIAPRAFFLFDF